MPFLIDNCPRCGAKSITFDVSAQTHVTTERGWQNFFEIFCVCRACKRATIFLVGLKEPDPTGQFSGGPVHYDGNLSDGIYVERFISIRDSVSRKPPEHVKGELENAFAEGAACLSIECYNAAATMFRLCVDLVTKPLLPDPEDATKPRPNERQRRFLGYRLPWLFDNGLLPSDLRDLADCIKEDGNDGAHVGNLTKEDTEDLLDFTSALLERLVTEPENIKLAKERRQPSG